MIESALRVFCCIESTGALGRRLYEFGAQVSLFLPRAHPLLRILAHGVHASRFRSYDGNAAHSLLHHHSFTWQVAIIMLAKLRTLVGVFRLGERRAARRGASMQRWQDGAAASGWRGTAGCWRPKDTRTPFCACRPPKWALGARPALEFDQDRHDVPIAVVRTMSHVCACAPKRSPSHHRSSGGVLGPRLSSH